MLYNFHTHTTRCGHAEGTEREMIETAIARGIRTLGFSDHAPILFPGDYYSTRIRMRPEELEDYVQTLTDLREEYRRDIEILIGLEVEYYPELFEKTMDFYRQYPIEYLILGQHYLYNEYDYSGHVMLGFDKAEDLRQYVDQVVAGLETGLFTYCAHPDAFRFDGDPADYEREMERLCRVALEKNIPLEINLYGVIKGGHYPNERLWRIAAAVGNEVILGIDAHRPWMLCRDDMIEAGRELAERCGIRLIDRPRLVRPF